MLKPHFLYPQNESPVWTKKAGSDEIKITSQPLSDKLSVANCADSCTRGHQTSLAPGGLRAGAQSGGLTTLDVSGKAQSPHMLFAAPKPRPDKETHVRTLRTTTAGGLHAHEGGLQVCRGATGRAPRRLRASKSASGDRAAAELRDGHVLDTAECRENTV